MRAEMDRIEQWIAARAHKATLTLILNRRNEVSWPRITGFFLGWVLLFIVLPTWLLGAF